MPSPFPGMDPYLEGSIWSSVHHQFSAEVARQLSPLIRPRYLALMNRRFASEMPRPWAEVREVEGRRLVTTIEILTSTDKEAEGREEYLARRRDLLQGPAHLLEIDLLREGMRAPDER